MGLGWGREGGQWRRRRRRRKDGGVELQAFVGEQRK